jgi:hypothetical protein
LSKFEETATLITNLDYLIAALNELGFQCEFHPAGAHLIGYVGWERPETAHVIILKHQIGEASNDLGFTRRPNGTFAAVLNEYDRSIGFDEKWIGRIHQIYKESNCSPTPEPRDTSCAHAKSSILLPVRRSGSNSLRGEACNRRLSR